MSHNPYRIDGTVEVFDGPGGWHYVRVPPDLSDELADLSDRGMIPIEATVGATGWQTSLLPTGDGSHFVALKSSVREAEGLGVGDDVTVRFAPREP